MNKTTGWILVIAAFVIILAVVFFATRHSQQVDATATSNATGFGTAYDATTGNTVPAAALPGTTGAPKPDVVSPVVATPNGAGS